MKKLLLPFAMLAMLAIPATANAEQCRNNKGQFAKCGTPGSMPDSQYQRKSGKAAPKAAPAMKPAAAPAMKPAAAPAMAPAAAKAAPAKAAKSAPCKNDKGKFIKCPK